MYLVQILLPVYDNHNQRLPQEEFQAVRRELTERYGGATAYGRAPAQGTWRDEEGRVRSDDVVVVEVMVESLERSWWKAYRIGLCARFRQIEIVIRATTIEAL